LLQWLILLFFDHLVFHGNEIALSSSLSSSQDAQAGDRVHICRIPADDGAFAASFMLIQLLR
jgi:hypothetical protein